MNEQINASIKPLKYLINIQPESNLKKFNGTCQINYVSLKKTNIIKLHSFNLTFITISINGVKYDTYKIDNEMQTVEITFKQQIPSNGTIDFMYKGDINDEPCGVYRCDNAILTHFEPTYARQCFPCIDEPNYKAIFNVKIECDYPLVLSNTSIKSVNGNKYDFNDSPLMSTYLLAFYMGNLNGSFGYTNDGIKIGIYSKRNENYRKWLVKNAIKCVEFITKLFDVQYSLDKLDTVFVSELDAGAMENWGLIVFKDDNENDNKVYNSELHKMDVLYVLFHEIAHQWFGNIVTMVWWSDLWLNESFATWLGWYVLTELYPEWNGDEQFYIEEMCPALGYDCVLSTHPIKTEINGDDNISHIFDAISYSKGSVIINMMANYIGVKQFTENVGKYIKKYKYSNGTTEMFLEYVGGKEVVEFVMNWIYQPNYPIINIVQKDGILHIHQEPYILSEIKNKMTWKIPLTDNMILESNNSKINKKYVGDKINKNCCGFYIINYDELTINNLLVNSFNKLTNLDLAGMINKLFYCLKSSHIKWKQYVKLISKIIITIIQNKRISGTISTVIFSNYNYLKQFKDDVKYHLILSQYVEFIFNNIGMEFKNDNVSDNIDEIISRQMCFKLSIYLKTDKYTSILHKKFNKLIENPNEFIYLDSIIVENELHNYSYNFEHVLALMEKRRSLVIKMIGLVNDINLYKKVLNYIFNDKFTISEKTTIISVAGKNSLNINLWHFIRDNWNDIEKTFENTGFPMIKTVGSIGNVICNKQTLNEIEQFFKDKQSKTVSNMLEMLNINMKFNENNMAYTI